MPPPPSFDFYAELQVEQPASSADINSAYRRLARIHHPDKNPHNQEEATATFQRLQLAYETLSDPDKRELYDNGDLWDSDDDAAGDVQTGAAFRPFTFSSFFEFFVASHIFRGPSPPEFAEAQPTYDELRAQHEADRVRRRQVNKKRDDERRAACEREHSQRWEAEKARREAAKAHRKAAEKSEALERRRLQDEEQKEQEKRWQDIGAVSDDEKLQACLHSDFCDKVKQTKKFKCTACSAKRGMTAFECPHCSTLLCQLCVTKFSEKRKKLKMQEQMEEPSMPDPAGVSGKPTTDKPNADEPSTGKPTTDKPKQKNSRNKKSSKQTSTSGKSGNTDGNNAAGLSEVDEDKAAPTRGGLYASDNPFSILANAQKTIPLTAEKSVPDAVVTTETTAPLSAARADGLTGADEKPASAKPAQSKKKKMRSKRSDEKESMKKNVNHTGNNHQASSDISVEPKAAATAHDTHRQTAAPSPGLTTFQDKIFQGVSNNNTKRGVNPNVSVKPKKPKAHGTPSRQQKSTGSVRGPTARATGGYIRASGPLNSLTSVVLCQAMEQFGQVCSLKITNKKMGIAHVDFETHDGLCRAMAAAPVVVGEQVTVHVAELIRCDSCGKTGHVAEHCRAAKSDGPN